jgi:hypothetical protein
VGATWSQGSDLVQIGAAKQREYGLGAEKGILKKRRLHELGSPLLFLIKYYMWGRSMGV